jgi:hypothetical protein
MINMKTQLQLTIAFIASDDNFDSKNKLKIKIALKMS